MRHASAHFGWLRLALASAVIFSHAPALVYGDLSHDPLGWAGPGVSLGALAVDGFFIVSGYLVTGSYLRSASLRVYLEKRVLRIYPAFIVMFLLLALGLAPWAGGGWPAGPAAAARMLARMALLQAPKAPGAFAGLHLPPWQEKLNLPLWTLPCEAACYLLVPLLAKAGLLRHPARLAGLAAGLLLGRAALMLMAPGLRTASPLPPELVLELLAMFCCGACYALLRPGWRPRAGWAALGALAALWCLRSPLLAAIGTGLGGGYMLLYLAHAQRAGRIFRWAERADFSYGLYIYAWPLGLVILQWHRGLSAPVLAGLNWLAALAVAAMSWYLVERPALAMKTRMAVVNPA
ncbi:acyltransferase [Acidocella sp.]|uniref:acyltransferase family protein n=1 Tax=Acidocella sp. TaxID=50710 RepID=UPI002611536D|nr:acyltransferase [Acidocella sp.]